ncbi:MBOAT family protein [Kineosporia sp. J2-2]|uniref:MBOAT family protein n=1 Tax=Kineosporia corallincola TaxID=2835133 RepID=A0ABS5TIZ1_9ACTN|nr:MBOAT family O-acyltransferase [Kineosporia corallincola]MBT0770369.1 MBOAT family protein [Kineosporia corallincola]
MVFSSPTFLFLFLPLTLLAYLLVPLRLRNACLLAASIVFYVWGAGGHVFVLLYVALVSYYGARLARRSTVDDEEPPPPVPRAGVAALVLLVLVPILLYKYLPPVGALVASTAWPGAPRIHWALPLGISFFTFHAISYVVDASRGQLPRDRPAGDYLLYLFLFPHQIAGPIVRYAEIARELRSSREVTLGNATYGLTRFAWGLTKKAYVADSAGVVAGAAFGTPDGSFTTATAWIGALAFAVQIYFDFSGYSDMAIGLAAIFGFRFPENFRSPYTSIGPADFWRRWHITLSRWFRDYVYIPLGGNRHGVRREYAALLITFLLTSLWHGATWGFLVWGGLHGLALLAERVTGQHRATPGVLTTGLRRAVTALFVVVSWVPFHAPTLTDAVRVWQAMFGFSGGTPSPDLYITLTPWNQIALVLGMLVFFLPRNATGFQLIHGGHSPELRFRYSTAAFTAPVLLVVAVISALWLDFSPFLYFQF